MRVSRLFIFYSIFGLAFSMNLMAGSEYNEAPPKGYKAPHASMMPGLVDPDSPKELDRFALQSRLVQVENQQIVLEGIQEPKEKIIVTPLSTTMDPTLKKGSSSHPEKLKVRKEKKAKKPKALAKDKRKQEEKITNVVEPTPEGDNDSRPQTMIIKYNDESDLPEDDDSRPQTMIIKYNDENDLAELEKLALKEGRILAEKKLPSRRKPKTTNPVSVSTPANTNIFDELIGPQKKRFTLPSKLEAWELLLILLAGNQKEKGMTYKVYFPDRNLACNYKSLLQGKTEDDLVPFFQLNQFREEPALLTLRAHLIILDEHVKRNFSPTELREIKVAKTKLQKKIDNLSLSDAGARLIADEKREISTLANHESVLAEYQLTEGKYDLNKVILSLTFYFQK